MEEKEYVYICPRCGNIDWYDETVDSCKYCRLSINDFIKTDYIKNKRNSLPYNSYSKFEKIDTKLMNQYVYNHPLYSKDFENLRLQLEDDEKYIYICSKCGANNFGPCFNHLDTCHSCKYPYKNFIKTPIKVRDYMYSTETRDVAIKALKEFFDNNGENVDQEAYEKRLEKEEQYKIKSDELAEYNRNNPKCPKCRSTAVTAGQRGYSIITGFFGSNQTVNRCASCGHKWKP